jgi:hypothetical protein
MSHVRVSLEKEGWRGREGCSKQKDEPRHLPHVLLRRPYFPDAPLCDIIFFCIPMRDQKYIDHALV